MKVLQIAPLLSVTGRYGGPASAAIVQCEALARHGHDVSLVAGTDGSEQVISGNYEVRLHKVEHIPGAGLAGAFSVPMLVDLYRSIPRADVVHVHMARDLLTLPAAALVRRAGKPLVVQAHGMIRCDRRAKSRLCDALLTRRVLKAISAQIVLTEAEEWDAHVVAGHEIPTIRMMNAVAIPSSTAAWPSRGVVDVAFCSRFHPEKRPMAFVRAAKLLLDQGLEATFSLIGPDGGALDQVLAEIEGLKDPRIRYQGALQHGAVVPRLAQSQVLVLPSTREHVPMVMLEALSVGVPVVVTRDIGIPQSLTEAPAVLETGERPEDIARDVRELIASRQRWERLSAEARATIERDFSGDRLAAQLSDLYEHATRR